jgi:hypothetical protein
VDDEELERVGAKLSAAHRGMSRGDDRVKVRLELSRAVSEVPPRLRLRVRLQRVRALTIAIAIQPFSPPPRILLVWIRILFLYFYSSLFPLVGPRAQ